MPSSIQNVVAFGYPRQLPQPLARVRLPMRGRQQIIPLRLVFILRGAGTVRIKIPHHELSKGASGIRRRQRQAERLLRVFPRANAF